MYYVGAMCVVCWGTGVGSSLLIPSVTVADDAAVYTCSATNYAQTTARLLLAVHCQSVFIMWHQ